MPRMIMKIETNSDTMIVTYDQETKIARILDDAADINILDIEDDSSWESFEHIEDIEEWLEIDYNNPDSPRVTAFTIIY